ncbi:MAG: hypothetical protein IIZ48_05435, partial [Erysipelotrichales bacterium]|nr:hypothetical protein [Erysipelotrichales bacterium]
YIPYLYFGLTREQVESVDAHVIIGGDNASTEWIKDPVHSIIAGMKASGWKHMTKKELLACSVRRFKAAETC